LRREIRRLREEATADLRPPRDYGDWTRDEQLDQVECKVRFRVAFHSDDEITRYPATDREIHVLGIWCAVRELMGISAKDREGYTWSYTFERSGLTIELTPAKLAKPASLAQPEGLKDSTLEEGMLVSVPRRIVLGDLPERLLRHFERMDPSEQPERDEYLYSRRHAAKEDLAQLRAMQRRALERAKRTPQEQKGASR